MKTSLYNFGDWYNKQPIVPSLHVYYVYCQKSQINVFVFVGLTSLEALIEWHKYYSLLIWLRYFLVFIRIRWIGTGSHPYEKTMSIIVLYPVWNIFSFQQFLSCDFNLVYLWFFRLKIIKLPCIIVWVPNGLLLGTFVVYLRSRKFKFQSKLILILF